MPNQFINHHTLDLMKTVMPYMHPRMQKSIEVISKAEEFMDTFHSPAPEGQLSAMSLNSGGVDIEDILLQLKSASTKNEQDTIDNMINIMKMQKLLQGYRSFMQAKQAAQNTQSKGQPSAASGQAPQNSQDTLMEFLMSQLSPEQKSNFENINMVLNAMNN